MGVNDASTLPVVARDTDVSPAGSVQAVADDAQAEAPRGGRRVSAGADAVLAATARHWVFHEYDNSRTAGMVPVPRPGWLRCGACGGSRIVLRAWAFHTRPGTPTVPRRCDVHVKCGDCAAGWWHGVAVSEADWATRPRPVGLRSIVLRLCGSLMEPWLWASNRHGRPRG